MMIILMEYRMCYTTRLPLLRHEEKLSFDLTFSIANTFETPPHTSMGRMLHGRMRARHVPFP